MDESIRLKLEGILSRARKSAEQAEVFFMAVDDTPVIFEANRLKQLQTNEGMIVALRLVRNGRIGFSTATSLDDLDSLVSRAVEVAQFGAVARFELPDRQPFPQVAMYDPKAESFEIERMVDLGQALIDKVREHTPDLLCDASVGKGVASLFLANSKGGEAEFRKTFFVLGLEGNLIKDTDMLFVGDGESSCQAITDISIVASSVVRQLELAKRQASVSGGTLPVIFTPHGVVSALLAPLTVAFNGRVVLQKVSPLVGKVGQKVFSDLLSLRDDSTLDFRPRSRPCDDEGIASRNMYLVKRGVIGDFLYDLQTAGMAGVHSTGSGDRVGASLPAPSTSNLVVEAGRVSLADMVRDIKEGLLVEQLMGASQTNVLGGDFSGNVLLGYKIEKGEIVGRVKDTLVSGNVYQVLNRIVAVGSEARWVGSVFTPPLLCADLTVGSKG
jgi:PmbA protein